MHFGYITYVYCTTYMGPGKNKQACADKQRQSDGCLWVSAMVSMGVCLCVVRACVYTSSMCFVRQAGRVASWRAPCALSHAAGEGGRLVAAGGGALHALRVDSQGELLEAGRTDLQTHVACLSLSTVRSAASCVSLRMYQVMRSTHTS